MNNTLAVVDYSDNITTEFDLSGTAVRDIDISAGGFDNPAGGTWAPASSGTGQSLYVVDRAIDGSSPVDGKIAEFAVGTAGLGPEINVTPTPVQFGPVAVGATPTLDVTIENLGGADLNVTGISITSGGPEFSVSGGLRPPDITIAPGNSHTVTVQFAPTAEQSYTGNLQILSDDNDEPTVDIPLDGTGAAPGARDRRDSHLGVVR